MEKEEQRNISRWQARNLELDCQQIVCTSIRSSEKVWGYTNTKGGRRSHGGMPWSRQVPRLTSRSKWVGETD